MLDVFRLGGLKIMTDKYGFKFKGIIQNENKDECNVSVTSNDKEFLEYFKKIIKREFQMYNIRKKEHTEPEKGDYCDMDCIHYISDYETRYDNEGNAYDEDVSHCELGKSAIDDNNRFCKYYEDLK